jgi:ribose 5-phosphate isomerase A
VDPREDEKRAAAEAAAHEIRDGMTVGLGTGSTVAHFIPVLAALKVDVRCVATSVASEEQARAVGLAVQPFDLLDRLDIAVDGADQVSGDLWLVKGGGGAHVREKIVAAAADRFVVIVSSDKLVEAPGPPIPMEVLTFGLAATLRRIRELGLAEVREAPPTPDGNALVDYLGPFTDAVSLSAELDAIPGVVGHGLFAPDLVSLVLIGRAGGSVDRLER